MNNYNPYFHIVPENFIKIEQSVLRAKSNQVSIFVVRLHTQLPINVLFANIVIPKIFCLPLVPKGQEN